jgi:hypothetical protein
MIPSHNVPDVCQDQVDISSTEDAVANAVTCTSVSVEAHTVISAGRFIGARSRSLTHVPLYRGHGGPRAAYISRTIVDPLPTEPGVPRGRDEVLHEQDAQAR